MGQEMHNKNSKSNQEVGQENAPQKQQTKKTKEMKWKEREKKQVNEEEGTYREARNRTAGKHGNNSGKKEHFLESL